MEIQKLQDVVILRLRSSDLTDTHKTAAILEDLLKVDGERKFVADLSAVQAIASLQAGAIVTMHLLCYENLAVMKLAGVHERVKDVLRLIGLDQLMEIHHGAEVARSSFGAPRGPKEPPTE